MKIFDTIKRRIAIRRIRMSMAVFGYPLNTFSDDEIEEAANRFAEVASQMGVSTETAIENVTSLLSAMNEEMDNGE